jgi:hypothetical protein
MSSQIARPSGARLFVLKLAIKADAAWIRSEKPVVRALQRSTADDAPARQSALDKARFVARARLVVYGLLRGRTWAQIESNHPDGDPRLAYALARVWNEFQQSIEEPVMAPEQLLVHLSP